MGWTSRFNSNGTLITSVGSLDTNNDTAITSVGTLVTSVGALDTNNDTAITSVGTLVASVGTLDTANDTARTSVGTAVSVDTLSVGVLTGSVGTAVSTDTLSVGTLTTSVGTAVSTDTLSVGVLTSTDCLSVGVLTSTDVLSVGVLVDAVQTELSGANGITTWKTAAAAANGVSLSEALRFISENQSERIVEKAADMTGAVTDNLFTVTGECMIRVQGVVTTETTRGGGAVALEIGTATDTDLVMPSLSDIRMPVNKVLGATDAEADITAAGPWILASTCTILMTIDNTCDAGGVTFFCEYKPLSSDGTVVAA